MRKTMHAMDERIKALEGMSEVEVGEYREALATHKEKLYQLYARLEEVTKRLDDIELKITLARPGKKVAQR